MLELNLMVKPQINIESELRINVIIYDINILAEIV